MLTLLLSCFAAPSPPDEVAVEARWPGVDASTIERTVVQPLEHALGRVPDLVGLRCEALPGVGRCFATLTRPDLVAVQDALAAAGRVLPAEVERPVVWRLPEVPRQARWLVLSGLPVDELLAWQPGTVVHQQWGGRCDGEPAVALELAGEPTAPPPPTARVRTRTLGVERIGLSSPDEAALDQLDAALDGLERCLVAHRGRVDGWVVGPAVEVAARVVDLDVEVVPTEAACRRFRADEPGAAALAEVVRALDGVLTVRAQVALTAPEISVQVDPVRAARLGIPVASVAAAVHDAEVDSVEALRELEVEGVRLSDVATITRADAPTRVVRVDGQRAALLDVILAEDRPAVRQAVDAALSGATPLEPWATRLQRP